MSPQICGDEELGFAGKELAQDTRLVTGRAGIKYNSSGRVANVGPWPKLFAQISHLTLPWGPKRTFKGCSSTTFQPGTRRKAARGTLPAFTESEMSHELFPCVRRAGTMRELEPGLEENLKRLFRRASSTLSRHSLPHSGGPRDGERCASPTLRERVQT